MRGMLGETGEAGVGGRVRGTLGETGEAGGGLIRCRILLNGLDKELVCSFPRVAAQQRARQSCD